MKLLVVVLLIVLLLVPTNASAGSDWGPIEMGKNMVTDGITGAFRAIADEIMELICGSEETDEGEKSEHGAVTSLIIKFATWGVKPFAYPSILSMLGVSFIVGVGMLVTYAFIGAAGGAIRNDMGDYIKNSMTGIIILSFTPLGIWVILLFATVMKTMMMESIANSISLRCQMSLSALGRGCHS